MKTPLTTNHVPDDDWGTGRLKLLGTLLFHHSKFSGPANWFQLAMQTPWTSSGKSEIREIF